MPGGSKIPPRASTSAYLPGIARRWAIKVSLKSHQIAVKMRMIRMMRMMRMRKIRMMLVIGDGP